VALATYLNEKFSQRSTLLMTHAVVGYPSLHDNWRMLECMQQAGVDLVELQLPFTEAIADGPMFIKANQAALEDGLNWNSYFDLFTSASKEFDFPLLFMGYYNTVFCMGHEKFCDRLKAAGGEGFIIADLPPEQGRELNQYARGQGLDPIMLMTPVNSEQRLEQIAAQASGFVYCVARKGVTGKHTELDQQLRDYMQRCRTITNLPLALGFGIKSAEDVRGLKGIADIVIVGTACLEAWEDKGQKAYLEFLKELREATQ